VDLLISLIQLNSQLISLRVASFLKQLDLSFETDVNIQNVK
jgi:hypothetical protein